MKYLIILALVSGSAFAQTQKECREVYATAVQARIIESVRNLKVMTGPRYNDLSFEQKKMLASFIGCAIAGEGKGVALKFLDYRTGKVVASVSGFGRFSVE